MKLLISILDEVEAVEAVRGGADIIDVKNPKEGSLGASFPWVIKRVVDVTPKSVEVSCTLGDSPNLPGTMSLAALGAAATGVDFIKTGLCEVKTKREAILLMSNVTKAAKNHDPSISVVVTGYADAIRIGAVSPLFVPEIAAKVEADVAMIDTAVKDGRSLFNYLTSVQLKQFIRDAHDEGLKAGIAGALKKEDLKSVFVLGADIVGLRGAACTSCDRIKGRIDVAKVRELAGFKKQLELEPELRA